MDGAARWNSIHNRFDEEPHLYSRPNFKPNRASGLRGISVGF